MPCCLDAELTCAHLFRFTGPLSQQSDLAQGLPEVIRQRSSGVSFIAALTCTMCELVEGYPIYTFSQKQPALECFRRVLTSD